LDKTTRKTNMAWDFLEEYLVMFDQTIFTSEAYVPPYLKDKYCLVTPALDPMAHKNKKLDAHEVMHILG